MAHQKGQYYKLTWGGADVAGITNISDSFSRAEIETTDGDSGDATEFIPDRSSDTVSVEIQYDPSDTATVSAIADMRSGTVDTITIEARTSATGDRIYTADGFATSMGMEFPDGDLVTRTIDFRITGGATITAAI